jgi:hypothetical protein
VIEIGLRLADVQRLRLQSEPVAGKMSAEAARRNLWRNGAGQDEIAFLVERQRTEGGYEGNRPTSVIAGSSLRRIAGTKLQKGA